MNALVNLYSVSLENKHSEKRSDLEHYRDRVCLRAAPPQGSCWCMTHRAGFDIRWAPLIRRSRPRGVIYEEAQTEGSPVLRVDRARLNSLSGAAGGVTPVFTLQNKPINTFSDSFYTPHTNNKHSEIAFYIYAKRLKCIGIFKSVKVVFLQQVSFRCENFWSFEGFPLWGQGEFYCLASS